MIACILLNISKNNSGLKGLINIKAPLCYQPWLFSIRLSILQVALC